MEINGHLLPSKTQEYQQVFPFCARNPLPAASLSISEKRSVDRNLIESGGVFYETENHQWAL